MRALLLLLAPLALAAPIPIDLTALTPGPISVTRDAATATVHWLDESQHKWEAVFNLEPARPHRRRMHHMANRSQPHLGLRQRRLHRRIIAHVHAGRQVPHRYLTTLRL